MASPTEIAKGLPETLPEDFGEWDSEPSATAPGSSGGFEPTRGSGEAAKPPAPTPGPKVTPTPVADSLRGSTLPSPAMGNADGAFLPRPARSPNSVSHRKEAARPTHEVPLSPQRLKISVSDGRSNAIGIPAPAPPSPDEFVQLFRPKITATIERKQTRKKWMMVAAVSASSVLVLVILVIRLFTPGTPSTVKKSVEPGLTEPGLTATETQPTNNTPKPSPSTPSPQDKLPTATQTQQTAVSQPTEEKEEDTPPEVQSSMMNDQLAAPTRIPRDIKMPAVETAPPPSGFATSGAETLGGGSAIPSVFNGIRPTVHAAASNPTSISAGVAVGLLIQKAPPVYPAIAKAAHVSGTVEIQATISKTGTIQDMHIVSGPVMLRQAALDAVRTWRYKPYRLNNEPTEVQTTINVIFSLGA